MQAISYARACMWITPCDRVQKVHPAERITMEKEHREIVDFTLRELLDYPSATVRWMTQCIIEKIEEWEKAHPKRDTKQK